MYESPYCPWAGADEANVTNILNTGPTIVNSMGHSDAVYDSGITPSDIAGLTNSFPYFMYSEGCDAGALDPSSSTIAQEQIVAPHGALGVVMNTNLGWYASGPSPSYSYNFNQAFWNAVFVQGKVSPGEANEESKYVVLSEAGFTAVYRWIYFETTLYGDPETPLQVGQMGEIRGTVWNDANHSGTYSAGDTGVAGDTVFVDLNQNGILDSSSANPVSTDVPLSIPAAGTYTSTLTTSNLPGLITGVTVTLDMTWPYAVT